MSLELYSLLKISPTGKNSYIVLEDFKYDNIIVPKGYKTNGADIPRFFWSIYSPFKPEFLPAVVLHDYLCDQKQYVLADAIFKKCLNDLNIKKHTIFILHKSVVSYHIIRYYIPNKIRNIRIKDGV